MLTSNSHYTALFNKILVPYKKLRQTFYPLEKAGYNTHFLEQNAFKSLRNLINPIFQNKDIDDNKIEQLLNNAQKDEKILFVFLKKYDSLTQTNGECIDNFFQGLKDKWYDFMYEIEKLPADERQAYADKRFNQANDGLKTKCADLLKNSKKQNTAQNTPEQKQQETYQEEEVYDF